MCHTYVFFILKWAAKVIACFLSLKCVCFFFSPLVYFIATACWCEYISFSRFVTIILYAHFYIYLYVYFMLLNNVFILWIRVSFFCYVRNKGIASIAFVLYLDRMRTSFDLNLFHISVFELKFFILLYFYQGAFFPSFFSVLKLLWNCC